MTKALPLPSFVSIPGVITIPEAITLSKWANALIIDFPNDNIPILEDETKWKEWGDVLIQENSFSRNGAPGTQNYSDWHAWAKAIFYTMSGA